MEKTIELKTRKQKVKEEFAEYFINVAFLALFFCAYATSRRLTLAQYGVYLDDYFIGLIKAMVIGKVIMLASFLSISKRFEGRPLFIPIAYKVFIFALFVVVFDFIEGLVKGMISTSSFSGAVNHVLHDHFSKMWLGGMLMVVVAFIPFFALKELSRALGGSKFRELIFKRHLSDSSNLR